MDDQPPRGDLPTRTRPRGDIPRADIPRADIPRADIRADERRPLPEAPERFHPESPGSGMPPPGDGLTPRRSRFRRTLWLVLLLIVIGIVVWWVLRHHEAPSTGRFVNSGPMPVGTATVAKGDMPVVDNALGTVTPLATVTVQTQINGQLIDVGFQEGQIVKKGDFLAQIDPRPYQVALEQAQGTLAKDQAALADAKLDLARYEKLVAQNSIASQTLDTQRATVAQDAGTVQVDQAQVDAQKLNLAYCHITAPVGGRVGLRQVDPGNYIQTSSTTGIVVITQLQPISVIFTLPEDSLQAVLKQVYAGQTLVATAYDRTGNTKIEAGQLATVDNQIDTTTGTVKLRATFANTAFDLFPNQFVNIKLTVDTLKGVDIVPEAAIQRGAPGTFVYLVKPDETVAATTVTLGPDDGENVAVLKGLNPGDKVVTDGADRLKDGAKVTITEKTDQQGNQPAGATPGQQGSAPAKGQHGQGQGQHGQGRPTQGGPGSDGQAPGSGQSPAPANGSSGG
ncbi:MAG: MdtA/MuxA family multidrug efflux RND transporter periplasmic adaptor subunit [Stellaceae bacterium]